MLWKITETFVSSVTLYQSLQFYAVHCSISALASKLAGVVELETQLPEIRRGLQDLEEKWKGINRGRIRVRTKESYPSNYVLLIS